MNLLLVLSLILSVIWFGGSLEEVDSKPKKYIVFGVNYGEGLNLRRDVYGRMANTIRQLRKKGHNYHLVLPPFQGLPHWRREDRAVFHRWSDFFDFESLNEFIPVIELDDYIKEHGVVMESSLYLQHYEEGWGDHFEMKYDLRPCIDANIYYTELPNKMWQSYVRSFLGLHFKQLRCLSIQGQSSTLADAILKLESNTTSLLIERSETILHDHFGDKFYWEARRSMRYSKNLTDVADQFRSDHLNSTDENDRTLLYPDWREHKPKAGQALGGPYLAIHWRRRDFLHSHKDKIPTVNGTVKQVKAKLEELKLNKVFVCTDSDGGEWEELKTKLASNGIEVLRFGNDTLTDGQVSIIDQWIAAHARYFIGTHVSTFSFRIHEDREILGFDPSTTFNDLCPDDKIESGCEQPAKWTIKYDLDPYYHRDEF